VNFYITRFYSSVELVINIDKPSTVKEAQLKEKLLRATIYRMAADLENGLPELYFNQIAINPSFNLGGIITGTILIHYPLSDDDRIKSISFLNNVLKELVKKYCK